MPSGLDGNPNPIVTPARDSVIARIAERIFDVGGERVLVAIDGRSGAGKSTFANELAARLVAAGRQVVRSTFWSLVVFLEADRRADTRWLDFLLGDLPEDAAGKAAEIDERLQRVRWPRYRAGWRRYADAVCPADHATIVVDNNEFAEPRLLRTRS